MSFFGDLFKIAAIGAFFVASGGLGLVTTGSTLATALQIGGYVLSYIGSLIDRPNQLNQKQLYRMATEPGTALPVVYGRAKVGGIVADWFVDPDTGYDNSVLYMAVAICHGSQDGSGIASVDEIWVNGLLGVTVDGDTRANYFTTEALDYTVLLGTDTQNVGAANLTGLSTIITGGSKAFSDITDSNWSATTDTGKGVAVCLFRLLNIIKNSTTLHDPTFQGPPSFSFVVTGNSIYDTRTSTWVDGGDNPAMCIRDYLTSPIYGCGFDSSLIDDTSFEAAADYCDAAQTFVLDWTAINITSSSVANPSVITTTTPHGLPPTGWGDSPMVRISGHTGSTPDINGDHVVTYIDSTSFSIPVNVTTGGTGGTITKLGYYNHRFTCNGAVDTSRPTASNIQELLSSCRGQLVWEQGQFKLTIRNGSPTTVLALTVDNILGQWKFSNAGLEEKWNTVKVTYLEPLDGKFKAHDVQWPILGATNAYLTADNGFTNQLNLNLPFTNTQIMAQSIAQVTLNESRLGITCQVRCTEEVMEVSVGDVVTVTHPTPVWTDKPFWVTAVEIMPDMTVTLNLQEYDSTAYDPGTMEDLRTYPATGLPPDIPYIPPPTSEPLGTDLIHNGDIESGTANWMAVLSTDLTGSSPPFPDSAAIALQTDYTTPINGLASLKWIRPSSGTSYVMQCDRTQTFTPFPITVPLPPVSPLYFRSNAGDVFRWRATIKTAVSGEYFDIAMIEWDEFKDYQAIQTHAFVLGAAGTYTVGAGYIVDSSSPGAYITPAFRVQAGSSQIVEMDDISIWRVPVVLLGVWHQDGTVAASQSGVLLTGPNGSTRGVAMLTDGVLGGLSIQMSSPRTAGTLTASVLINGSVALSAPDIDGTSTQFVASLGGISTSIAYTSGDIITVSISTSSGWTPTTNDVDVAVFAGS
jgi:Putative phage tail protein